MVKATVATTTATTTNNALRTLLEADEAWSAQQLQQPASSHSNKQQQQQQQQQHHASPNKRQRKQHSSNKASKKQVSEDDLVNWHVKSMLAVDQCLQNGSNCSANIIHQQQQAQKYKRQVAAARLQMTYSSSARHVPTDLPPPTFNKEKHAKISQEANLQRIAKKLQQMKASSPASATATAAAAKKQQQQRKRKSMF